MHYYTRFNINSYFREDVLSFSSEIAHRTKTIYLITADRSRNEPIDFLLKRNSLLPQRPATCLRNHFPSGDTQSVVRDR